MDLSKVKTGDILVYSGRDIGSKLIQYITTEPWDHVVVVVELYGQLYCIGSAFGQGVTLLKLDEPLIQAHNKTLLVRPQWENAEQTSIFINFLLSNLGKGYDYTGALAFLFRKVYPKFSWNSASRYFCSEYIALGLELVKIKWTDKPSSRVIPADFTASDQLSKIDFID